MRKLPIRIANDFPCAENVPCTLSNFYTGSLDDYFYIDLRHKTLMPSLVVGKEGKSEFKYITDRYFSSESGIWNLAFFIRKLGGSFDLLDDKTVKEKMECLAEGLGGLEGTKYYLKTKFTQAKSDKRVLTRGIHPFVSLKPDLKYGPGEDKFNKFLMFGKKKFEKLNGQKLS